MAENVEVHWSDKRIYEATIQALGSQKEMNALADAMQSDEEEGEEDKTDEEAASVTALCDSDEDLMSPQRPKKKQKE